LSVINNVAGILANECDTGVIIQLLDLGANNYDEIAKNLSKSDKCRCSSYDYVYSEILRDSIYCTYDKHLPLKLLNLGAKNYRALSKFIAEELVSGGYITLDQYDLYNK
jgi:hypothetical protein